MQTELITERSASNHDLAILRHPDRRTTWAQLIAATLSEPVDDLAGFCDERLREVNLRAPMVGARLVGESWRGGKAPGVIEVQGEPLNSPLLLEPFGLDREAPVRVLVSSDGCRIALVAHHAALDGRAAVVLLHALVGGPIPDASADDIAGPAPSPGPGSGYRAALRRLLRPVDRVPPSPLPPAREALAVRTVESGRLMVARIAAAAIGAIGERCEEMGWPWRRVGLSIPVGGAAKGIGNVATYRRIDLHPGENTRLAISGAIKAGPMPMEFGRAPRGLRLLSPISDRLSDSLLVSNHGTYDLPGVSRLEVFPVARGRSAVVFGSAAVSGGELTLSLRARDLTQEDGEELLDRTIERMEAKRGQ